MRDAQHIFNSTLSGNAEEFDISEVSQELKTISFKQYKMIYEKHKNCDCFYALEVESMIYRVGQK